jgi:tetraacyldisaccharide 4'-kinase
VDWSERLSATRAGRLRTWAGELHGALARARLSAAAARPHPASEGDGLLVVGGTGLGGSGKTPVVEWLARRLTAAGVAVAIVGHGFRAGDRTVRRAVGSFPTDGDEAVELVRALPEVPVWLGRPRTATVRAARTAVPGSVVLMDGGLGARDVPWAPMVLVDDATLRGGRFPAGFRRFLRSDVPGAPLFWSHRVDEPGARVSEADVRSVYRLVGLLDPEGRPAPTAELASGPWVAVSGIARPGSFHVALERSGARVVERRVFADHARLPASALQAPPGARVVVTRKDAARLPARPGVWVATGAVELLDGAAGVDALLAQVRAAVR